MPLLDGEQEKESNEQREDAQSFRNGEAEYQTAELAVSGRRVAQGARQVVAEDVAEVRMDGADTQVHAPRDVFVG